MRLLITGAGGQLGTDLVAAGRALGHDMTACTHADLDITDQKMTTSVIGRAKPDAIIHAAAWTAVDACESDSEKAMLVNRDGTANVVKAARVVGAQVLYVSTDYVFDGLKSTPYVESDQPNPQSVYGASKLAGELEVDQAQDLIVRISWVFGEQGANMVKTILRLVETHQTLTFVDDQIGYPSFSSDIAPMMIKLITNNHHGIWHLTNQGAVSWFGFARDVLICLGLDPERVLAVPTSQLTPKRPAPRPANSMLDNQQMREAKYTLLDDYHIPLQRLIDRLTAESPDQH